VKWAALLALIGATLLGTWLWRTGGSSPPYSEVEYTRAVILNIKTFIERRYDSRSVPKTASELRKLVQDGFLNEPGLTDRWGQQLSARCKDLACRTVVIYSYGPNRQDENGKGDDVAVEATVREGN